MNKLSRAAAMSAAMLLSLSSCGDKSAPTSKGGDDEKSSTPASSAIATPKPAGALPAEVSDLLAAVPENATLVASLPSLSAFEAQKQAMAATLPQVLEMVATASKIPAPALTALLGDFDGLTAFSTGNVESWSSGGADFTVLVRLKTAATFDAVVASPSFEKAGDDRWNLKLDGQSFALRWLPKQRVALVASKDATLDLAIDTLSGKTKSFVSSANAKSFTKDKLALWADLHAIAKSEEVFAAGSMISIRASGADAQLDYTQFGEKVPRLSSVFAPSPHSALGKLPAGTSLAMDFGIGRRPGKGIADLFTEIARASGENLGPKADQGLAAIGITLADLDRALGDSLAIGSYFPSGPINPLTMGDNIGAVIALEVKDDALAKKLFDLGKGAARGAKVTGSSIRADLGNGKIGLIQLSAGRVLIGFGSDSAVKDIEASLAAGKTLDTVPAYADYAKSAPASFIRIYTDFEKLAALSGGAGAMGALPMSSGSDILLRDSDKGLDIAVEHGIAAVSIIGTMSALAVYGVRSYLAAAKTSEAKNTVGAISRGAVAGYEREQANGSHALCKSATGVPAAVPAGTKYQPDTNPGKDYGTGDETTGWKCLRFEMTTPTYYKYEYHQGSGYKCTARGGADPGPNGFEVSAEGDLDGDGKTSLFCRTGKLDPTTNSVQLATELFIVDEKE